MAVGVIATVVIFYFCFGDISLRFRVGFSLLCNLILSGFIMRMLSKGGMRDIARNSNMLRFLFSFVRAILHYCGRRHAIVIILRS